jgi:hypothetical protein
MLIGRHVLAREWSFVAVQQVQPALFFVMRLYLRGVRNPILLWEK